MTEWVWILCVSTDDNCPLREASSQKIPRLTVKVQLYYGNVSHTRMLTYVQSNMYICMFLMFLMHMSLCIQRLHHHELVRNYSFIQN